MNKPVKMVLAGMAIAALSAGVYARGGDDCEYGQGYGMHGGWMGHPEHMQQMHEQQMTKLHDKLKLTASQEAAWQKFKTSKTMPDKSARPDPAEMDKLTAPQRLEKSIEHTRLMEEKLTEHLAALKEFYAALTPAQQKIFDEQTAPRRWHEEKKGK
jgi:protein CpxP